jgi:hypothetical protein
MNKKHNNIVYFKQPSHTNKKIKIYMNKKHNNIVYSKPSYTNKNKDKQKGGRKYYRVLTPEEIYSKAMSKRYSKAMLKRLEQIKNILKKV